jgi:hypothetical protein
MLPGDQAARFCCPACWGEEDGEDCGAAEGWEGADGCADDRGGGPPGPDGLGGCPDGRTGCPTEDEDEDGGGDEGEDPGRIRTVVSACLPSSAADTFFLPLASAAGSSVPGAGELPLTCEEAVSTSPASAVLSIFSIAWSRRAAAGREPGFP